MLAAIQVSTQIARRFVRRAVGLDVALPDVGSALAHHGYIQIDPINVCGRMHDLILRNRVRDYQAGGLMRHLHGGDAVLSPEERTGFEHHLPDSSILTAFPLDAWPHLLAAMRHRTMRDGAWSGKLTADERGLANHILAELAFRGPLSSSHIDDKRSSGPGVWGTATLAKSTLQKLFFHGRVLIAKREGNRRLYDLPEKVLPAATLAANEPSAGDTTRWLALTKLRQRRLVTLKREELKCVGDEVCAVKITDLDAPTLYCLRADLELMDAVPFPQPPILLAPLDPLIYDRKVTSALWKFDYTWEVYTPPHKRVRGYYALPILSGDELVGHVDPKANTKAGKLEIVSRSVRRGHAVAPAVKSLAKFLGLN
jgi:uncharacterized protein